MVSIPKTIGVMSCSVVLCLSLSNATQAAEVDPCADRKGSEPNLVKCNEEARQGIQTIKGEVLRIDGNDFLIQRYDGKEVRYRVDSGTEMSGPIGRGDRIEAKVQEVNEEKRVLSLRQVKK